MRKLLHLKTLCSLTLILIATGCQLGNDGPITSTLGFRDVPAQTEPEVETEEEIEARLSKSAEE